MNVLFASAAKVTLLAVESQQAVLLRLFRLGCGGPQFIDEASLMVREKIDAFNGAMGAAMVGGSFKSMVDHYRTIVRANTERLEPAN